MDGFLKIAGGAVFWLSLGVAVLGAMYAGGSAGGIALLIYGVPFMISGAAVYALGAILSNLIAIRIATERQTAALTVLAERVGRSTL